MKFSQFKTLVALTSCWLSISVVLMLVLIQSLMADEFTNVSDVKGCRVIEARAERLLCYDTVVDGGVFNEQKLKQVQVESFGSSKMTRGKPAATVAGSGAGAKVKPVTPVAPGSGKDSSVDRLAVTIIRSKKDARGYFYFQTSDGQVWKQQNSGNWTLKPPFEAEIKEGMLGSFFLMIEGGKSTRVKRVR